LTIHHIVFDGTSAVILLSTLLNFYRQLCVGRPIQIPDAPCGYERFVALEDELPFSKLGRSHAEYWRRQLSGAIRTCELPPDLPRAATPSFRGATVSMELPDGSARAVNALSLTHHVNRSVIFLGVFQLLLHRCTGQDEIIVGMPVPRRTAGEFADQVGYFINMVPIRIRCDGGLRFSEFLRTMQGTMLDALYHSSYPFSWMVAGLRQEATGKNSIFNIDFLYQD
jgi:hypothetical protein